MSTVSLSQEDRKIKLEEYIFQRRILLGTTAAVGLGIIVWIVAISTDHWFMVGGNDGLFIPETRRYFLSSHSGIWKVCRYTIIPTALGNMSVARNFSLIGWTNPDRINRVKSELSKADYIQDFAKYEIEEVTNSTEMSESFKKMLFATWVLRDPDFSQHRDHFYELIEDDEFVQRKKKINMTVKFINPTDLNAVRKIPGATMVSAKFNNTVENVLIPELLRKALFNGWEEKDSVVYLLDAFAKDMNINTVIINNNEIYVLRPPLPLKKKYHVAHGYEYKPFQKCKNCPMFPSKEQIESDPSVDFNIIDYNRSEASFAIITVMVMSMGFIFSIYTFRNPRYMFKRLAGGIHFISSLTSLVVVQVLTAAVDYEKNYLPFNFPDKCTFGFGYGYYLGYVVFVINMVACLLFLWYSKKRKGDKAATEELGMADEAINIGR